MHNSVLLVSIVISIKLLCCNACFIQQHRSNIEFLARYKEYVLHSETRQITGSAPLSAAFEMKFATSVERIIYVGGRARTRRLHSFVARHRDIGGVSVRHTLVLTQN